MITLNSLEGPFILIFAISCSLLTFASSSQKIWEVFFLFHYQSPFLNTCIDTYIYTHIFGLVFVKMFPPIFVAKAITQTILSRLSS